ncbi:MAG: septation protein A [Beijerinckiaceae bacterium]|jgi:intracellular septation protein|nr:septation protein A [Beijerinckiaceae bacterium]
MTEQNTTHRAENGITKLLLEMGPLLLFFAANSKPDWFRPIVGAVFGQGVVTGDKAPILIATAVFMVGMAASLIATWALYRRLPIMPLVSGAVVLVFGGLTLALHNDLFIKLKPTIVNSLFGAVLLGGLAFGKPLLPYVLDSVFQLDREGWKKLTFRWGVFFFVLAAINEVVWRTQTTDFWVAFKVWGVMPLTMAFALAQTPMMMRHGFDPGK